MNFRPLFTATHVVTSVYRLVSTAILLSYLIRRRKNDREYARSRHLRRESRRFHGEEDS